MACPYCGSENIQVVSESKGFGAGKGCCGFIIFGWVGLLCGLCGMGKSKIKRVCANCGHVLN
ncbi:LITAF-like zinc ribbon domain-containing protein [Clostridium estertheticum]|uniref:LITAF-like zinc ribbon domain-containing protein n=1 Tax=Clostridium estertheticum TaxID=238834 RepID=UPI001C0BC5E9|nr:LITAF-like zinc ribbon domain-containing protein [Clostridium estertheticum]MBU3216087.1 LITAF-like zinc ribbon domain-containing protein [Clostridium estertheticum]WAG55926.1 LITAF-like zinc ribbon domain-containing protein [Clostridium estertheticum]